MKSFKPANLSSLKNIIDYDDPLFSRIEFVDVRFEVNRARLLVLDQSKLVFEAGNLILKLFLRLSETEKIVNLKQFFYNCNWNLAKCNKISVNFFLL